MSKGQPLLARSHSPSGHTIWSENGRALCSRVDPLKEAVSWVDHHAGDITTSQVVIVLGLGCGYHLVELIRRFPIKKILVLESNPELVDEVQELHGSALGTIDILTGKKIESFLESSRLQKALTKIFYLAEFRAGTAPQHDFYENLRNYILARERLGLQYHLRWRENLAEVLDLRAIFMSPNYLLSIKDLVDSIQPDRQGSHSARVLQALREFVK